MIVTISLVIDGQYILKYSYISTMPIIPYDRIDELSNAIRDFILHTMKKQEIEE